MDDHTYKYLTLIEPGIASYVHMETTWYIKTMGDTTHFTFSNDLEFTKTGGGTCYHVGQVREQSAYNEICHFLYASYAGGLEKA